MRAAIHHFVQRWLDIFRMHDWELLAVFVAAIGLVRGIVYALPRVLLPNATRELAEVFGAYVPNRIIAPLFVIAAVTILVGIYKMNYRVIRVGLLHGFLLWTFHGYLSLYEGLLPSAVYQIGAAIASALMFVRANVEHPNGAARAEPKP